MKRFSRTTLLACLVASVALAQGDSEEPGQPSPDAGGLDLSGLVTVERETVANYPVAATPELFVANQYGAVQITTWESPVIRVTSTLTVGAEDAAAAERFAQSIVEQRHTGGRVEVRTRSPNPMGEGRLGYVVNYSVVVPPNTEVTVENFFGDSSILGVTGSVNLDSRFGVVLLRDLGGFVRARARGEFPLTAHGLRQGGVFILRGTRAAFSQVSGTLDVSNHLGSIEVRSLGALVDIDLSCENGPIHLYLPQDARPDLTATAVFGDVTSDFAVQSETWGHTTRVRTVQGNTDQRIALNTTFGDLHVHREAPSPESPRPVSPPPAAQVSGLSDQAVKEVTTDAFIVSGETEIFVNAVIGDVRIEGVDEDRVTLTVTKHARLTSLENARLVLEGLAVRVKKEGARLHIRTVLQDDLESLGCTAYRIDLAIRCPRTAPLRIYGREGHTVVFGTGGPVVVEQVQGTVSIEHAKGELHLDNQNGDIEVLDCAGPVTASGAKGTVAMRTVYGEIDITCVQGKVIIDAPHAGMTVRNRGGDVRIIALEGINGDYNVVVEDGDLSIVLPESADATLWLNAHRGRVHSSIPLTGTMKDGLHAFQGRLGEGVHRVFLETHGGDIIVD